MARGWESKSVESQIESEGDKPALKAKAKKKPLTGEQLDQIRKKESLILSRTRILHEIETAANPRYKAMLNLALQDLNARLAALN